MSRSPLASDSISHETTEGDEELLLVNTWGARWVGDTPWDLHTSAHTLQVEVFGCFCVPSLIMNQ